VFTEGGVIQPGEKLLDVVPLANPLIVEARLRLGDVNEVMPGRRADVRLTGINHVERPTINGVVQTVSADRLTDKDSGEGYYALQVALNADDVKKSRVELQAGMPAEVIVTTRPRTLFEYLISPLRDEITGAFRER
jgi:HlyD family secretion protein